MKKQLLENLIRSCTREVLQLLNEEDEIKGSPAPPADGQGTADQPAMPKEGPKSSSEFSNTKDEEDSSLKGIILVNPLDKSKLKRIKFQKNVSNIDKTLSTVILNTSGISAKISPDAKRDVLDAIKNSSTSVYLYLGKYDPNSDEIYLMSDKSLQVAKDSSISLEESSDEINESRLKECIRQMVNEILDNK